MTKKIVLGALALVLIAAVIGAKLWRDHRADLTVKLPNYPPITNVVWLDQHWNQQQRDWFYHADQGTQTFGIPYEWFVALEQPAISLSNPGLLSDPVYLDRYGFIPDTSSAKPELPIGFAHTIQLKNADGTPNLNPQTKLPMTSLGLTCAACHTGRLTYQSTTMLIDGGPALTNLALFQKGVALSLLYTRYLPLRFGRFADRVLGPGASDEAKSTLKSQLDSILAEVKAVETMQKAVQSQTIEEGYARLDALNRIGNITFAVDRNNDAANFVAYSAPVHFPRIWQASWFAWVQYNGSIGQPMTRNAGEALGVGAKINLTGSKDQLFASSTQVQTIFELEQSLAGTPPPNAQSGFNGLTSPKWPGQILPPINTDLAAKGAALYKDRCEHCHMAPVSDSAFWESTQWSAPNSAGERYLNLAQIDIQRVGTDPAQAEDMSKRQVALPASVGITATDFGTALSKVVENTVNHWYDNQQPPTPDAVRQQMNGFRPNDVRAPLSYKVRPLNGIWATPPYLHNGSVPNLFALLSPVEERPKMFYLGNREYDPVNVGYRGDPFPGGFAFDTSLRGNHNTGHEFSDDAKKPGVIGPALTPDQRRQLIEYLKSL
jgi:hypothetical protein